MNCTRCGCDRTVKSGFNRNGKQRFECKACHYHFIEHHDLPDSRQSEVIRIYCSGVSIRQMAKLKGVSHTTARRWIKRYALNELPDRPEPMHTVSVIELDEQWHFLKKRSQTVDMESR